MTMDDHEVTETVRTVWDHSSTTYDDNPGHGIGTVDESEAWKRELSRDLPSTSLRVLDVGCGTGAMGLLFAEMGHRVTGIDLSEGMMEKARKKAEARNLSLDLRTGNAERLPFPDGSFDLIVTRHLLWTLPHPEIALRDWHRVLVPGGRLLVIDGIWDDHRLSTRVKMGISSGMTRIFEQKNTHRRSYDRALRSRLPYEGGVPLESMLALLERAGFLPLHVGDLLYIRDLHRSQLPWYRRLAQGKTYYLVASITENSSRAAGVTMEYLPLLPVEEE